MRLTKRFFALLLCMALLMTGCTSGTTSGNNDTIETTAGIVSESVSGTGTSTTDAQETVNSTENIESNTVTVPEDSTFEIHFIDVGQADCALILCDGEAMMIDGGNSADSSLVYAYLQKQGIDHLEVMVATHSDEDHCGGLSGALNYATVDVAYCSVTDHSTKAFTNFVTYLAKQDKSISVPSAGDVFTLGSAICTILGPINQVDDPNDMSIVIRIEYGDTSFLFTGDAEYDEEMDILDAGYDISCDVLKVGHHGSSSSTGYQWLKAASPTYAVISVGTDNSYGHPTETVLSRLRDADVTTYRTDLQGTIICTSDGQTVSFAVEKNQNADTLAGAGDGGNHTEESPQTTEDSSSVSEVTYIVNMNSKKFHEPACGSVKQMAESNKLEVICSREELIADGYSPCGNCDP